MGRYKDESLDNLVRRGRNQVTTTNDQKIYADHSEMFALKEAGAVIEHKQSSLSALHFETVFEGLRFIHICSEQSPGCVEGGSLTGGTS